MKYFIKRILLSLPVAFGVLVLVFLLIHLAPGDPVDVMLGDQASSADREQLRNDLHLNDPLLLQFGIFMRELFTGELKSLFSGKPVMESVFSRLWATVQLALAALAVSLAISIPMGVVAAIKRGTGVDHAAMGFSLLGVSMPTFWLGPMLILVFSIKLGWTPVSGQAGISHIILPALTLGAGMAAIVSRMIRSSLLEAMDEDFIRTARAKGLSEWAVVTRHGLRNALIPVITVVGLQAGALLSGAIITETIFVWPGIGRLLIEAINSRDFPLVQGAVLVIAMSYVIINLITDLLYAAFDPRVRLSGTGNAR